MEGGAADRNHSGEGQGEPTPQGTTEGEGGIPWGEGGGRGGLAAALHHMSGVPSPPPPPNGMVWYGVGGGGLACAERGGSWRNGQTRPA